MTGSAQHIENGQVNSVDKKIFREHLKVHTVHIYGNEDLHCIHGLA